MPLQGLHLSKILETGKGCGLGEANCTEHPSPPASIRQNLSVKLGFLLFIRFWAGHKALPKSNLKVVVNDVECTAEDVPGEKHSFAEKIEGVGEVTEFYIVANARQPSPGLAVRVRGRVVKEPSLFGVDTRAHGFFTAEKIIGEASAEFLDAEDDGLHAGDLINTTRDGFQTYGAMEPHVLRFIDNTHASATELFGDAVMRNCLVNQG